jgi:transcriptional regulator with XRE-family HTH domain
MARDAEKLAAQGKRIRDLRDSARVSQEVAARNVGVTLRAYQRWERGEGEISPDNIQNLAKYFDTTPDYIEYGVMQAPRGDTHAPADRLEAIEDRLEAIEQRLDKIIQLLKEGPPV